MAEIYPEIDILTELRMQIDNGMKEIFEKEAIHQLNNHDFIKLWTDVVKLPMFWYDFVIESSMHTQKGYDRDEAVIYGLMTRIYKIMCYERRITCKRVNSRCFSTIINRLIFDDLIKI